MAEAEINLALVGQGRVRLREEVPGRVQVRALEPLKCQGIELALGYFFSGSCDGGVAYAQKVEWEPIELAAGTEFQRDFVLRLPEQPISFEGTHFKIEWFVEVTVKLPWRRDLRKRFRVHVQPAPAGHRPAAPATAPATETREQEKRAHW